RRMSEDDLRRLVTECGFACGEAQTAAELLRASAAHTRAEQVHDHAETSAPVAEHEAKAHAGMTHAMGSGEMTGAARPAHEMHDMHVMHGSHGMHDMSDPAMARAMEADMRRRFFVALVLTIPIVLYSSLGV